MKQKILEMIFEGTLFAIVARSVIVGPNLADAIIIVGLLGAMSFKTHVNKVKLTDKEEVIARLQETENKVDLLSLKAGMGEANVKRK